jgi:xanthine/CO dehydrogenase XdhC/CoxF family maturation factor/MOSC domain-containing protein YiiM
MGKIVAICISKQRGTPKTEIEEAEFLPEWGIEGDAHGGNWHRQVSLLSYERIEEFRQKGAEVDYGAFGENLVVEGFDLKNLPVGTRFRCGDVLLELTQIGKECHSHCEIYERMGDCIMPREGVFAVVLHGGVVRKKDAIELIPANLYRTLADRRPGEESLMATVVKGKDRGEKALWINQVLRYKTAEDSFLEKHKKEILENTEESLFAIENNTIYREKTGTVKKLVICGAGHVSIPMITIGKMLGFEVTVLEDRPGFANQARKAMADTVICRSFREALQETEGSSDTYFVVVTRGHRYDLECLREILNKQAAYVGMMGSRRRAAMVKENLKKEGYPTEAVEGIYTPIGLSIAAETPQEIAVSVMAEIIQVKNRENRSSFDKELLAGLLKAAEEGRKGILCTIVERKGSAPRQTGTKMLLMDNGEVIGTIGGGCAESNILQIGREMLREQQPAYRLEAVDMTAEEAEEAGMVCGGTLLVYMESIM